jgi:serine/threonine protein kinase
MENYAGTLDYMAPEVLVNPCTRLEEQNATQEQLDVRKIVPYTCKVDVWATGVLAYELVMGRPPFEVEKEAQTVALILQSEVISFSPDFSSEWANFVRWAPLGSPLVGSHLVLH